MNEADSSSDLGEAMLADLRRLLPEGMTLNGWAVAAGVNRTVWGDIRRHGNPSRRTLEKLLDIAGSSLAEFEALRVGPSTHVAGLDNISLADGRRGWRGAARTGMAVRLAEPVEPQTIGASRIAAFRIGRQAVASVARPASLARHGDSYGFRMPVANMWPRFRQGRILVVTPSIPPMIGEDILLTVGGTTGEPHEPTSLVAELVWQDETAVRLRSFAPAAEFTVSRDRILRLDRIAGEAI